MVTSAQLRAARSLLNWTVRDLAEKAGVHRNTVTRAETDETEHGHAVAQMIRTLEFAGVEFTNGGQPGVRMKMSNLDIVGQRMPPKLKIGDRVRCLPGKAPQGLADPNAVGVVAARPEGPPVSRPNVRVEFSKDFAVILDQGALEIVPHDAIPLDRLNASNDE